MPHCLAASPHLGALQGLAVIALVGLSFDVVQQHVLEEDDGVVTTNCLQGTRHSGNTSVAVPKRATCCIVMADVHGTCAAVIGKQ
jgi:hypothetical protein